MLKRTINIHNAHIDEELDNIQPPTMNSLSQGGFSVSVHYTYVYNAVYGMDTACGAAHAYYGSGTVVLEITVCGMLYLICEQLFLYRTSYRTIKSRTVNYN